MAVSQCAVRMSIEPDPIRHAKKCYDWRRTISQIGILDIIMALPYSNFFVWSEVLFRSVRWFSRLLEVSIVRVSSSFQLSLSLVCFSWLLQALKGLLLDMIYSRRYPAIASELSS